MAKFTKKPLIVDAFKYGNDEAPHPQWFNDQIGLTVFLPQLPEGNPYIVTGRGDQIINNGDYVIKGVHGELYPCSAGIFADTYDAVDQEAPAPAVGNDHTAEDAQQFTEEEIALNAPAPAADEEETALNNLTALDEVPTPEETVINAPSEKESSQEVGSAQAANIA